MEKCASRGWNSVATGLSLKSGGDFGRAAAGDESTLMPPKSRCRRGRGAAAASSRHS
eukprot:CAMPEP_0119061584 /NCGR_PEP_ID=MMETSP1178-20130426/5369_1 /TAXON_ID=33656 /ORGANISM="unid sp, Strain CCMP2000" /LENGTH=56 /DNA_ID=CAMNT_0007042809 /DNA_START=20 /DNA_END=190 /DNA_ORIENTATION=-